MANQGRRKSFRVRDMVLSMAVLGLVVAAMYVFTPRSTHNDGPPAVDYTSAVPSARRAAPYPLVAPGTAPAGWRATSVKYDAGAKDFAPTWHLGFMTPDKEYAAVEQGRAAVAKFAKDRTQGARAGASVRVGGESWTRWDGGKHGYRGLVRGTAGGGVTAVVGTGSWGELEKLAGSLTG